MKELKGKLGTLSIAAAAGLLLGGIALTPAQAADLGGDCCADLEERVAELEATTVRKGNKKVSVTLYGQVSQAVLYWDIGVEDNVYVVDNDISSTRFGFKGSAKIDSEWSAGYRIEVEWQSAASNAVNEFDDNPTSGNPNMRQSHWYIKNESLGTISVGLQDTANSGIAEIDISGTNIVAQSSGNSFIAGFGIYTTAGVATGLTWGAILGGNGEFNRLNVVKYTSPTIAGFQLQSSWGEDDLWDVALRYAGELGDFKIAAGIAYGENNDRCNGGGGANCMAVDEYSVVNGSISVVHTPTGLFVTASAAEIDDDRYTDDYEFWMVRAGITQKWNHLGNTAIYGSYADWEDDFTPGFNPPGEGDMWGAGIVQNIDAAAMELYLGYQHYEVDLQGVNTDDADTVVGGGRIKF